MSGRGFVFWKGKHTDILNQISVLNIILFFQRFPWGDGNQSLITKKSNKCSYRWSWTQGWNFNILTLSSVVRKYWISTVSTFGNVKNNMPWKLGYNNYNTWRTLLQNIETQKNNKTKFSFSFVHKYTLDLKLILLPYQNIFLMRFVVQKKKKKRK